MNYPKQGDIIYTDLSPTIGHEQSGKRPVLVISNSDFNKKTGLCVICPISGIEKGYLFEVKIKNSKVDGVVLTQQIKTIDWEGRGFKKFSETNETQFSEVFYNINQLIKPPIA